MKKLISSLALVLVLCLVFSIGLAAQDAVPTGVSYGTLNYTHNGVKETTVTELVCPTCTTIGQADILCEFDGKGIHKVTLYAMGHVWDTPNFEARLHNDVHYMYGNNSYWNYLEVTTEYGYAEGWYHIEKDAKDPCLYHVTCAEWDHYAYDGTYLKTTACNATKDFTVHKWSSEYDGTAWGKVADKQTCITGGIAQDYCIVCGAVQAKYRTIEPTGHHFDVYKMTSYPHCEKGDNTTEYKIVDGVAELVCARCGAKAVVGDRTPSGTILKAQDLTLKLTLSADKTSVEYGIGVDGKTLRKEDQDALKKSTWPDALHDWDGAVVTKKATCTEMGQQIHWCLRCGTNYYEVIPKVGHDFVKRVTLKNCFLEVTDYVCTMCGKTYDELYPTILDKNGKVAKVIDNQLAKQEWVAAHTYNVDGKSYLGSNAVYDGKVVYDADHPFVATCTKGAYRAYRCIYCYDGAVNQAGISGEAAHPLKYVEVAPARGHNWGDWVTIFNPGDGDNVTGFYARKCNYCGAWDNRHSVVSPVITPENGASAFVQQVAAEMVGDNATEAEVAALAAQLKAGTITAADVVATFANTKAFETLNPLVNDRIDALYQAMLGRPSADDPKGVANWNALIASGASQDALINGFAGSNEFAILCAKYGVTPGTVTLTESRDLKNNVRGFVTRCYNVALGRGADEAGLNDWTNQLLTGANTAQGVAYGFVFSPEFDAQGKIAAGKAGEVVDALYALYLNRAADAEGRKNWVTLIEGGLNLEDLNNGFANSPEFAGIVTSFGLYTPAE